MKTPITPAATSAISVTAQGLSATLSFALHPEAGSPSFEAGSALNAPAAWEHSLAQQALRLAAAAEPALHQVFEAALANLVQSQALLLAQQVKALRGRQSIGEGVAA